MARLRVKPTLFALLLSMLLGLAACTSGEGGSDATGPEQSDRHDGPTKLGAHGTSDD